MQPVVRLKPKSIGPVVFFQYSSKDDVCHEIGKSIARYILNWFENCSFFVLFCYISAHTSCCVAFRSNINRRRACIAATCSITIFRGFHSTTMIIITPINTTYLYVPTIWDRPSAASRPTRSAVAQVWGTTGLGVVHARKSGGGGSSRLNLFYSRVRRSSDNRLQLVRKVFYYRFEILALPLRTPPSLRAALRPQNRVWARRKIHRAKSRRHRKTDRRGAVSKQRFTAPSRRRHLRPSGGTNTARFAIVRETTCSRRRYRSASPGNNDGFPYTYTRREATVDERPWSVRRRNRSKNITQTYRKKTRKRKTV